MSTENTPIAKRVTVNSFIEMKADNKPIAMLTAYDYPMAYYLDQAGIDGILVGDSVAMVELGYETTLGATMDTMVHHTQAVRRGVKRALLVADMPFMSYQVSIEKALENAGRLIQEGGADAVKLEGGDSIADQIEAIVDAGIPVMGHLGMTPQSFHKFGGYGLQAKTSDAAKQLIDDALLLQDLGCFSIVLEKIPAGLAVLVSRELSIPTIGIGAGSGCDGQILVTHDMLGMFERFRPKFVKQYLQLSALFKQAFEQYISEVRSREFPGAEHSYPMDPAVLDEVEKAVREKQ
jgi:3-methyl-2-oxobutanoate hydroxymethyltransferase